MQNAVQGAHWHVLADHHKVRGGVAATNHGQHIGVGENPEIVKIIDWIKGLQIILFKNITLLDSDKKCIICLEISQIYLSFGYSSLKSLAILGVHSLSARILAAISFPCHFPLHVSPLGLWGIFQCNAGPLCPIHSRCGNLCMQVQLVDVDPFVPGQGGISASGLETKPWLVLEFSDLHVLSGLGCSVWQVRQGQNSLIVPT